jgi:aryl-alcohol dehydrogenase-like predicted oxidoreductase
MIKRQLGRSGIEVHPLAFGGNVFGWTVDEKRSFELLDAWVDAGMNFIDTADVYSGWVDGHQGGESETIIGKWLAKSGKRDKVVIATKVGMQMGPRSGPNATPERQGLKPAYIRTAVEDSLRRLQTDRIDLYQSHKDDESTPMEETLQAYADLIKAGKVRAIGASNFSAARLVQALEVSRQHGLPRYETLQPLYNLVERPAFEAELEPVVVANGLGVLNFYALASGFLTGKYRSEADLGKSPRGSGAGKYLNAKGLRVLKALDDVAARHGSKPASVALAWQIARPSITAPIASATSLEQLESLVAAATLQLGEDDIKQLNEASSELPA